MRRQRIQDITHYLRTPITAIRIQFEGMRDGVIDISQNRIEKSPIEIARIEILCADLEEFMRLKSPEMRLSVERIEFAECTQDIAERFAPQLVAKTDSVFSYRGIDSFRANLILLQRVVTNFFTNAIRYTPEEGSIELSIIGGVGAYAVIMLVNSGEPIPPDQVERIFDRLYCGEHGRRSPGSVLDLTIAKRIAELHGGSVSIRNPEEGGVVVEMTI